MSRPAIRLVLFDIAGTLMAEDGHTLDAYHAVCGGAGLTASDAWIRSRMGMKKAEVFAELLGAHGRPEIEADDLAEGFDAAWLDVLDERPPRLLPGVAETWAALPDAGVTIGTITGFSRTVGDAAVAGLGLHPSVAVGSDEVAAGRPAPDLVHEAMRRAGVDDAATVAVVGDTPHDLECGTAAGAGMVVGVGHGTHDLEQLRPHPHTHLVPTLEGFSDLVRAWGAG